jgi:tetratricopeptide (TPR) repeat protein
MKFRIVMLFVGIICCLSACVDDAAEQYHRGVRYEEQGRLDKAVREYEKATRWGQNHPDAHHRMGVFYLNQGRLDRAVGAFRKAISLRPKFAEARSHLAIAYQQQGKLDEALAAWERAKRFDPKLRASHNLDGAYNNLGMDYVKAGEFDLAVIAFKTAQSINPNLAIQVDSHDAEAFNEAIAAHTVVVEATKNLGTVYFNQDKMDEAIDVLKTVIRLDPSHAGAHYSLAQAYAAEGESASAIESLWKAIALDRHYLEKAQTARHFERMRHTPKFVEMMDASEEN